MRWASTVSLQPRLESAVAEAASALRSQLSDVPDFIIAFVSEHYGGAFSRVPELIKDHFPSGLLLGCSAGGVVGGGREVEQRPGFSLTAAVLPEVELTAFHIAPESGAAADVTRQTGVAAEKRPHFVVLADPFTFDPEPFLRAIDQTYPHGRIIGGLASGGRQPGANALFLGSSVHGAGLVGVALSGNIEVDTIVAQGCRPIGLPMFVTRCQGNVIEQLDGRPAMEVLQDMFAALSGEDQRLAQTSLFLGVAMTGDRQEYRQGDFLIRNLVGIDTARGAIAVGTLLESNAIVQFHLRDARTSASDLEQLLSRHTVERHGETPAGALLFSCLGRGMHLYGRADHDTDAVRSHLGDVPLGGFFCNGEIGPVHGTTFLHGYTSAFGLFRPRSKS